MNALILDTTRSVASAAETRRPAMPSASIDFRTALDEVSASSAGGAPFLLAFGFTLFASGVVSLFVPVHVAAIVVMFQGNLALPLAFWLERKMGWRRMDRSNPLMSLSVLIAASQLVALPAVVLAYNFHPSLVPAAMAAVGGAHFLPYAWLHRTRIYTFLGIAISVGAFALVLALGGRRSFQWVLFYMAGLYWATAPFLASHARRIAPPAPVAAGETLPA